MTPRRPIPVFALCLLSASLLVPGSLVAAQSPRRRPAPPSATALQPPAPAPAAPALSPPLLKALQARAIGPAVMGGRVSDIALDPEDPAVYYVALGRGGLMKTTDNGGSFSWPMEKEAVSSMGAVAVAPSNAQVVWVGTGEANDRNSSGWGNGVYRSTDGGKTWVHAGLASSRTIARIAVHPRDPDTAYVAAMGDLWSDGGERGLFKTTDGGRTWTAVLTAPRPHDARTGCGDVALDPSNPDTVYAVLYARRRTPWAFTAGPAATGGEDVGGIFKSTDGGRSWTRLAGGLPARTGRIGLAVHAKNPRILYAIVESFEGGTQNIDDIRSKRGGVFRSEDGGATWTRQNALNPRPFYFSQIRVDPQNDRRVYVLGYALHVSEDGGSSFREDHFGKVHADNHALAIDPRNPKRLLLGTDGGVYESWNAGAAWRHVNTFAAGEFYRIAVDTSRPYRICGGLQDNLNWVGPSETRTKEGIVNSDWINIYGGDGFYCVFDPDDPQIVYAESQSGYIHRLHLGSGAVKNLRPEPAEGQEAFRFHWNSPFIPSRHVKGTMYLAGNRVFALTDRAEQWRVISPDLSTRQVDRILTVGSGAETYGVVYALAESPIAPGMLWAGTDDGKVWVTEDEGQTWTDLTASLPAEARGQWIARIEPSAHDARVAYLVVSAFRSGDYRPLVYKTADRGKTWQSLSATLRPDEPVRVVREDPKNPRLLFLGAEFGLYVSLDGGASWMPFGGLPTVPVDDLVIHPRDDDLVIATHGRSLYIVDDIRPLRELAGEVREKAAHLFPVADAEAFVPLPGWVDSAGSAVYRGVNPAPGAAITVWIKAFTGDSISLAVTGPGGVPVANLEAPGTPGLTRVTWDLKVTKDLLTEYGGQGADRFVRPGEYEVTLTYGKVTEKQRFRVTAAPWIETR
jgi:photosystem II stability/assembly factor-like uncharacterized protein